jgi:hypothetical protein
MIGLKIRSGSDDDDKKMMDVIEMLRTRLWQSRRGQSRFGEICMSSLCHSNDQVSVVLTTDLIADWWQCRDR